MIRQIHLLAVLAVLATGLSGCGKAAGTHVTSAAEGGATGSDAVADGNSNANGPAAAVREFLEAVRTGNDDKAWRMLSSTAREKMSSLNRSVTPPASDTARFSIGKVDYVNDDGARVACTWTDLDDEGRPTSDQAVWVLRREQEGWRVAGVAFQIFPGEAPLVLNFEDPEDMFRKQQWGREELRRRMAAEEQAQSAEKPEKPMRR